jgi:phage RecT family recombinase
MSSLTQYGIGEAKALIAQNQQALISAIPKGARGQCSVPRILEQLEYQMRFAKNGDKLRGCTPHSILAAVKYCCTLGLEPGFGNGTADVYLIPYDKEMKAQTSYTGELRLAMHSGFYKKIFTRVVYKRDKFREWVDETGEHFSHEVDSSGNRDDDDVAFVYAVAIDKEGNCHMKTMSADQVDALEKKTRKRDQTGAWKDWWQQMAQKTVLRSLLKTLPKTQEQMIAETMDNEALTVEHVEVPKSPEALVGAVEIYTGADSQKAAVNRIFEAMGIADEEKPTLSEAMIAAGVQYSKTAITEFIKARTKQE